MLAVENIFFCDWGEFYLFYLLIVHLAKLIKPEIKIELRTYAGCRWWWTRWSRQSRPSSTSCWSASSSGSSSASWESTCSAVGFVRASTPTVASSTGPSSTARLTAATSPPRWMSRGRTPRSTSTTFCPPTWPCSKWSVTRVVWKRALDFFSQWIEFSSIDLYAEFFEFTAVYSKFMADFRLSRKTAAKELFWLKIPAVYQIYGFSAKPENIEDFAAENSSSIESFSQRSFSPTRENSRCLRFGRLWSREPKSRLLLTNATQCSCSILHYWRFLRWIYTARHNVSYSSGCGERAFVKRPKDSREQRGLNGRKRGGLSLPHLQRVWKIAVSHLNNYYYAALLRRRGCILRCTLSVRLSVRPVLVYIRTSVTCFRQPCGRAVSFVLFTSQGRI